MAEKCDLCEDGVASLGTSLQTILYGAPAEQVSFDAPVWKCDSCGETYSAEGYEEAETAAIQKHLAAKKTRYPAIEAAVALADTQMGLLKEALKPKKVWPIKLYCIVSAEAVEAAGGNRGKMIAQGGHAFVGALMTGLATPKFAGVSSGYMDRNRNGGFVKICLIASEVDIVSLYQKYKDICGVALITDAAHTVFKEPRITCLGLGPIRQEDIGDDLKALKVFI